MNGIRLAWTRPLSYCAAAAILAMGLTAQAQDRGESESYEGTNEHFRLSYADDPASEAETEAVATTTTEEKTVEHEPYDIWTTKRLTGDWGGFRSWLDDEGIDFSMIYTGVYQQNFRGGIETHNSNEFAADFRMNLYLDLDKMGLVPGGFFFIRGKSSYNDGARANVGSLSTPAWVVGGGDEEYYLDKWWYGQRFFDNKLEFRIGKLLTPVDLFDTNVYAQSPWDQFLNSAMDFNQTVPHRKAPGIFMKWRPCDEFYFQMAGVNADQRDSTRPLSFDTTFHNDPSFIGLWELGWTPTFQGPNGSMPGNYRFGWYYDPRPLTIYRDSLGGVRAPQTRGDDVGFYLSFDQLVFKENDDPKDKQGLGAFVRYGYAHRDINAVSNYWQVGAQYEGLIPNRDKDVLAFGVAQSIMSSQMRHELRNRADRETVYELYYAIHVTPWLVVSPDLQVITNPGGSKDDRDALVGSIRVKLSL